MHTNSLLNFPLIDKSRQSGDFEAYSAEQDDNGISRSNDTDDTDMLDAFLKGTENKPEPEVLEYSY